MVAVCMRDKELADLGQGPTDFDQGLLEKGTGASHGQTGIDKGQPILMLDGIDVDRSKLVGERQRDPVHPGGDKFRTGLRPLAARGNPRGLGDAARLIR